MRALVAAFVLAVSVSSQAKVEMLVDRCIDLKEGFERSSKVSVHQIGDSKSVIIVRADNDGWTAVMKGKLNKERSAIELEPSEYTRTNLVPLKMGREADGSVTLDGVLYTCGD